MSSLSLTHSPCLQIACGQNSQGNNIFIGWMGRAKRAKLIERQYFIISSRFVNVIN